MKLRFSGKVAVVTGAGGGIGRAAVLRFAAEGASVIAVDLDEPSLDAIVAEVESRGGSAFGVRADVSREPEVEGYVAAARERFGGVDFLFNNAGIEGAICPIQDYPLATFEKVMAVNATGVFLGIKHAAPAIQSRGGGAIVNTASVAGLTGNPLLAAYNASKHAVIGLTRSAALTYAPEGVRINAICPSPIETRMMRALEAGVAPDDPGGMKEKFAARIPAGRYGEPEEVASLVAFLCSDEAAFINGSVYTIDGAMTPI